jgi:hypothetical protein
MAVTLNCRGLVFVGEVREGRIEADVYLNNENIAPSPLSLTLDQWTALRALGTENDGENPIWATTEKEYEEFTGEPLYV